MNQIVGGLWKLNHVRLVKPNLMQERHDRVKLIQEMEDKLRGELARYLDIFNETIVALLQADLMPNNQADKIIHNLSQLNQSMNDLIDGYSEVRNDGLDIRSENMK